MLHLLQNFISNGIYHNHQIIFIDFSETENHIIVFEELIQEYKLSGHKEPPVFIFDELQELPNFPHKIVPSGNYATQ